VERWRRLEEEERIVEPALQVLARECPGKELAERGVTFAKGTDGSIKSVRLSRSLGVSTLRWMIEKYSSTK
jgi:hypothetical protein